MAAAEWRLAAVERGGAAGVAPAPAPLSAKAQQAQVKEARPELKAARKALV